MSVETGPSAPPSPLAAEPRRRFLVPEVVQTSAMDCGPAALKCLLEGFGVPVSYGRLREACQTSVDGTSIDTLESVAGMLGLEAEQIMLPVEHVLAPGAGALPAIAVVRLPSGMTHFVVLWRRLGPYVQVMDPARGRRWVGRTELVRDLLVHTQAVDAAAFADFAAEPVFRAALRWRLGRLLGPRRAVEARALMDQAAAGPSWRAMASLDAAVRAVESLVAAGVVRSGAEAQRSFDALAGLSPAAAQAAGLGAHAAARPAPDGARGAADPTADAGPGQVLFSGAVLVHVAGRRDRHVSQSPALSPELAAALSEKREPLARTLARVADAGAGRRRLVVGLLAMLVILAAAGTMAEVILTRPLLDGGPRGGQGPPLDSAGAPVTGGFAALVAVVLGLLVLELPLSFVTRRMGRALDRGLRRAFLRKLPRLGDRYFSSRPVSDMAERAHLLHRVRLLPGLGAQLLRAFVELSLMAAAIAWIFPPGAPVAFALLVLGCAVPLAAVPALAERDLRLRTHSGSLMRFYLDALLGLSAVRTHGAERAVLREHDARLLEWRRAGRDMVRTSLAVEATVLLGAAVGAGVLVTGSLAHARYGPGAAASGLLLLFFALGLPTQAARLIALWRQLPDHRNVTLRLLEPLGALDERGAGETGDWGGDPIVAAPEIAVAASTAPSSFVFEAVSAEAGGHLVLTDLSLEIAAGSHVAVVGASGAGKSSLIGLLLGFHRPSAGRVLVDGRPLHDETGRELAALRALTAWIEPGVQLWNRSLADNLGYGAAAVPLDDEIRRALAGAELEELAARLPRGMGTLLGEGGGLLSGGEGQRVRLARELVRVPQARLVLLDEPFRGLDRPTRARLLASLRRHWAAATLLFVTHDVEHTRGFPRVLLVDEGRIVEDGDPATLAWAGGSRYRAMLEAEARVRERRWSAALWQRLVVRDGGVYPPGPPRPPPPSNLTTAGEP